MAQEGNRKLYFNPISARISRISWRDLAASLGPVVLISAAALCVAFYFVRPAPPSTITLTSGPDGSSFRRFADQYAKILARNGIHLEVLPSRGALENLQLLRDADVDVDVGFVQGGLSTGGEEDQGLVSLGSVFYEPVAIFYRGTKPIDP